MNSQTGQAATAGVVALTIPGLHIPAVAADLAFLIHKMAYCCWGIGEIRGCKVLGISDFQNILALWSGAATIETLSHRAISKAAYKSLFVGSGIAVGVLLLTTLASCFHLNCVFWMSSWGTNRWKGYWKEMWYPSFRKSWCKG